MTAGWIALVLAGAVFLLTVAAAAVAAWAGWPLARRHLARVSAATRARAVFLWRLMPLAAAACTTIAVTVAFAMHEPRGLAEPVGALLHTLAVAGGGLALAAVARLIVLLIASERLAQGWTCDSAALVLPGVDVPMWLIKTDYPLVAIVGIRRPRLVVSRSVAENCSLEELAAIAAHERGHINAADNLKRLLLQSAVDPLALARRSRDITACWQEAVEDAADDHAASYGARAVDLASALVSVARLATGRTPVGPLPASVFHRGGSVERRVRRLLAGPAAGTSQHPRWASCCLGASLVVAAAGLFLAGGSHVVYQGAEWLVRHLP